ncbi:MAG TPA: ROK family protein [Bacillota bacterium]|nr:ROK family protein [Bacillota bacterium]
MNFSGISPRLKNPPVLDEGFRPLVLENRAFLKAVGESGLAAPVKVAVEREKGQIAVYETQVFANGMEEYNCQYIERLIKTILWLKGGVRIIFSGPDSIYHFLRNAYAPGGVRAFDAEFMSRVYEREFTVELVDESRIPLAFERAEPVGGSLEGCRIGFDAGGSDRKVAALLNGEVVFSEEVIWHPKTQSDPDYHYHEIKAAILKAASYLPRVDAIGVSSAGIYVNNRTMVASLFLKVPPPLFDQKIKDIYLNIAHELGDIPIEVRNDGDVTALAGAMSLQCTNILGIAMGTSQAAGYIDGAGNITGCLNELAFVPVDNNPSAAIDEWSGDRGCGVKYFSQDAVIRLAPVAGIQLKTEDTPALKLTAVQELLRSGDERAEMIFETIGCYLGYSLAYYAEFYDLKHTLILGRVTSGAGGNIILKNAREVLELEFPELAQKIQLHLPDENSRRVGQAIAAAGLPILK